MIQRSTRLKIWKKKSQNSKHLWTAAYKPCFRALFFLCKHPASESHLKCSTSGHRHFCNQPICHFFSAGIHLQHFIIYLPVTVLQLWWCVSCFSNFISTTFLLRLCHLPTWAALQLSAMVLLGETSTPQRWQIPRCSQHDHTTRCQTLIARAWRAVSERHCSARWDSASTFSIRRQLFFFPSLMEQIFVNTVYIFHNALVLVKSLANESALKGYYPGSCKYWV